MVDRFLDILRKLDVFIFKAFAQIVDTFWRNPFVCGNLNLLTPYFQFVQ